MYLPSKKRMLILIAALVTVGATVLSPLTAGAVTSCNPGLDLFCDNFTGHTLYKDQSEFATWHRYAVDEGVSYEKVQPQQLRLSVTTDTTATNYSNANISTSEINIVDPHLDFGVDTRAEAKIKFSPNLNSSYMDPGTAKGSAGFLFWNYFQGEPGYYVDPEDGNLENPPQDVIGFIWMDSESTLPGFSVFTVINGVPAIFQPLVGLDMSEYHLYAVERTHDNLRFFVDDQEVAVLPINQEGGYHFLPDDHGLAADVWIDNASYNYNLADFSADLTFHELAENQYVDVDYVRVTEL